MTLKDPAPCFRDRASLDQVCPAQSAPDNTYSPGGGTQNLSRAGRFASETLGVYGFWHQPRADKRDSEWT
jgi:hypothetical protein